MTTTATGSPPAVKAAKKDGGYIVFRSVPTAGSVGGEWEWVEQVRDAKSGSAAIKSAVGQETNLTGTFVAVPARSWKPVKVTAKTETRLVVEDAS